MRKYLSVFDLIRYTNPVNEVWPVKMVAESETGWTWKGLPQLFAKVWFQPGAQVG
jgi:hypothetical protein